VFQLCFCFSSPVFPHFHLTPGFQIFRHCAYALCALHPAACAYCNICLQIGQFKHWHPGRTPVPSETPRKPLPRHWAHTCHSNDGSVHASFGLNPHGWESVQWSPRGGVAGRGRLRPGRATQWCSNCRGVVGRGAGE